jgi:hypothetical protein
MDNATKNSDKNHAEQSVNKGDSKGLSLSEIHNPEKSESNFTLAKNAEKFLNPSNSHYIENSSGLSMGLMGILKIKNILNYKDLRSVIHWCIKNDVFIIHQGNKQFVNKWEFILSFYKPFIKHLKKKHDNWKEVFLGYVKGDLGILLGDSKEEIITPTNYKAKNKSEVSFLAKMKKI